MKAAALAILMLCPAGSGSQTIVQSRHAFDQGGGMGAGGSLTLRQSIGQPFTGKGSGSGIVLDEGFLAPGGGNAAGVVSATLHVSGGWNMLSVPLNVIDYRKTSLFPTAVSNAFMFTTMYVARDTLTSGAGYWVKFRGREDVAIAGTARPEDTIDVSQGWNLIGTTSSAVAPASVGSIPGGMIVSNFFAFDDAYIATDSLRPGVGYWVKVNGNGVLILSSSGGVVPPQSRVRIVPDREMPPEPPSEVPATARPEVPAAYALHQNYPNPFNPVTEIRYDLPDHSDVQLRVYNILGEIVATLVDGVQAAGYRAARFDASTVPSGVYFYSLKSGTFSAVRKMIVLK